MPDYEYTWHNHLFSKTYTYHVHSWHRAFANSVQGWATLLTINSVWVRRLLTKFLRHKERFPGFTKTKVNTFASTASVTSFSHSLDRILIPSGDVCIMLGKLPPWGSRFCPHSTKFPFAKSQIVYGFCLKVLIARGSSILIERFNCFWPF